MKRVGYVLILAGLAFILVAACGGGSESAASSTQSASTASALERSASSSTAGGPGQAASSAGEDLVRQVLYSLEPGEMVMQGESFVGIATGESEASSDSPDEARSDQCSFVLVLSAGTGETAKYFVFRDGKKTGPYDGLEPAMTVAYGAGKEPCSRRTPCAVYKPGKPPEGARVEPAEVGGGTGIKFNGKTFGPYVLLYSTQVTPDGSRAYFTATNDDKAIFGCTDGRLATYSGTPGEFKLSPDGKSAALLVEGTMSLNMMKKLTELPPEKIAELMKDQDKKFLYTIDGKKFGPFEGSFASYSFWFAAGTNDLYYRVDDDVYRNGELLLKSGSFDSCGFYPSPDGKKYVLYDYDKISFSDGKSYPSPLDLAVFERGGVKVFKWLTLENRKDFVVYERSF